MGNRTRSGFLVLVALTLSVLLVQPICEAHEPDAADSAACWVATADAALVDFSSAIAALAAKPAPAVPIAEVLSSSFRAAARDTVAAALRDPPLASFRYHARSARILS